MIAVIDYKAGNLSSVMKALNAVSGDCRVTADPAVVRQADKIVLPGVGHFAATGFLDEHGLTEAIRDRIGAGVPFLGICVGLQWLFESSTEAPGAPGLGIFAGACERFPAGRKCPHVGWNSLHFERASQERASERPSALTAGIDEGAFAYYTHSYRAPVVEGTVATTDYGGPFSGIVARDNVMGVQFHPEKSGATGLRLLRNFAALAC